ncbi:MAG: PAS domain S-box protein [Cytophagaceae bacterium]
MNLPENEVLGFITRVTDVLKKSKEHKSLINEFQNALKVLLPHHKVLVFLEKRIFKSVIKQYGYRSLNELDIRKNIDQNPSSLGTLITIEKDLKVYVFITFDNQIYGCFQMWFNNVTPTKDQFLALEIITNFFNASFHSIFIKEKQLLKERSYKELVENSTDIIYRCNAEGNFIYVNPVAIKLSGYSEEEILGKSFLFFIREDYRERAALFYLDQFTKRIQNTYFEYPIIVKTGEVLWLGQNVQLKDEGGWVTGFQAVARDITKLKKAEADKDAARSALFESEQRFRILAENAPVGIFLANKNGEVVYVNKKLSEIVGFPAEEFLNDGWKNAVHPEDLERLNTRWMMTVKEGREFKEEGRFLVNGEVIWFLCSSTILRNEDETISGYIGTIIDITESKKVEQELIMGRQNALQSLKERQHFLSVVSHEIRTPMNAILGMTNLLIQNNPHFSDLEYLRGIKKSSENLLFIINDILDFTKIESGKLTVESIPFNLKKLLDDLLQTVSIHAKQKKIDLEIIYGSEVPQVLEGDPVRINQIMLNIVINAIKFTEKGKVLIDVTVKDSKSNSCLIELAVRDTGIGVPIDKIDAIFDSFTQASKDTTRKYGGTGLGLAISKRLIELLGGNIKVESEVGKGSCFKITLPFIIHKGTLKDLNETQIYHFKNAEVLIVEDNEMNKFVATEFLRNWGVITDTASNGMEAFRKIENKVYDLILMDLQMPLMNGYKTSLKIRKSENQQIARIPIVALTASVLSEVKEGIYKFGMDGYLLKPFKPEELNSIIARYIPGKISNLVHYNGNGESGQPKSFDLTYLKNALPDHENIKQLIAIFLRDAPNIVTLIKNAIRENNHNEIFANAHKLKSMIKMLGGSLVLNDIIEIEKMGKAKAGTEEFEPKINRVEQMIMVICSDLKNSHDLV